MSNLLEFWKKFNQEVGFHPDDDMRLINTLDWTRHESGSYPTYFHKNFVPVPYVGNLDRCKIVLLMLNPGYRPDPGFPSDQTRYGRACSHPRFAPRSNSRDQSRLRRNGKQRLAQAVAPRSWQSQSSTRQRSVRAVTKGLVSL